MSTKIHAITDGLGRCIDFRLTEGQVHESTVFIELFNGKTPENLLADKAYDSDAIRRMINQQGAHAVIPPKSCRKEVFKYDKHTYRDRCLVENFFQFIKRYRRIGTRYEMVVRNFAGMITMACILQWLIF